MSEITLNTPLKISEIDFRVQSINKGGYATILAYKDARVDMNRLDAVFGHDGWQKKYDLIDGKLFCSVGIYSDRLKEWIWKQDVGTESNTEKEKGQASDAFKRACFNLGIGRELYEYPLIQIELIKNEQKPIYGEYYEDNGRIKPGYGLKLKDWKWGSEFDENGVLIKLAAKDQNGNLRFNWKKL